MKRLPPRAVAQRATQRRDMNLEIAFLDKGFRPHARDQIFLADQSTWTLDQRGENFSRATAQRDGQVTV
jgi:hypothetical protein